MRNLLCLPALTLVACTSTTSLTGQNEPLERCESTSCFNQRQIRNYEIVDSTTLIVYVGEQECPFLVELTGTFCDVTFLPGFDVIFVPGAARRAREPGFDASATQADIAFARVCANDLDMGLAEDPFTSDVNDPGSPDGLSCRIQDIQSLTDDEILEIYVENQLTAPPPPFGTGEITTPENPSEPVPADGPVAEPTTEEQSDQ